MPGSKHASKGEKKLAKRKRAEEAVEEAANGATNDDEKALRKQEKRDKKRAKKERDAEAVADNGKADTESKEERRVRKAAKRAEKEKQAAAAATQTDEPEHSEGLNGNHEAQTTSQLSKAERKALKAAKKAARSADDAPVTVQAAGEYEQSTALSAVPEPQVKEFLESKMINVEAPVGQLRPIMEFSHLPTVIGGQGDFFKGFKAPTPIQAAAWPYLLAGQDVIGVAQTGSGKTLAFGLPCIRYVKANVPPKSSQVKAVVLSPTRELAQQIYEQYQKLAKDIKVNMACLVGGLPKDDQRPLLKKANIVIATPGRLQDFIEEGAADLSNVGYLVLDEADRMLDTGFEQAIRKIMSPMPREKQTLMFTATWPPSIRDLAATFMRKPVKISIGDNPTGELRANTRIKQEVEVVDPRGKEQRLLQLLKQYQSGKNKDDRILVFCLYKKEAVRVEGFIASRGFRVAAIHGDMSQTQRNASFESFRSGRVPLLVATDVAARGLDIPAVKVVINVTFPLTVEDYVHRIGRTGRAGADGLSVTLFTEHDKAQSGALINVLRAANQPVPEELLKFGTTVKRKQHDAYGAFYRDSGAAGEAPKQATKITFND